MCSCLWDAGAGENLKLPIFIGYSAVPNMNFWSNTNALLILVIVPSDTLGKLLFLLFFFPILNSNPHLIEHHKDVS